MTFMQLFCAIPFTIVLVLFITSLRNEVFRELSLFARFALTICALVPIWGVILAIFGTIYLLRDAKHAGRHNRIFAPTRLNKWLWGDDKCRLR